MLPLESKKILLGVTGGIAAYKIPILVRLLKKSGADVRVILTDSAKDFVSSLALEVLSENPVLSSFTSEDHDNSRWNNHVELGNWADIFLIAPATSNSLSAMANAKCNNLLIATYLSATSPVLIAPAMDLDMYTHPANKKNIQKLSSYGDIVFPVGEGFLASGLHGKGRMLEPELILKSVISYFYESQPLYGKKILITAGPTYEPIDPVRFLGNYSSGKMGFELAKEAVKLGGVVKLIIGPNSLDLDSFRGELIKIVTASEMFKETISNFNNADIVIAAAAVSDFSPKNKSITKIKKEDKLKSIHLTPTKDILFEIGKIKKHQIVIGFALESENEIKNALKKIKRKNLDAIILNSLNDKGAGFEFDTNKITFIRKNGNSKSFKLKSKSAVAVNIFNEIIKLNV
ncbi:MAG: bifunctional phosphopantothenoylcysteine decarboxylase/phosphopantothenate--cysteine ligase CoaBC [Flavobacteriaceae bacterium]|nr:bifunctional phosphopantothenoylcysteine decarboxylase/phosphopantothenate--cysteine ligase CoaBC [Flavobacteriaceae bacterium]